MIKRAQRFLVLVFILSASALIGHGQQVSLKLSGGINYLLLDDVNRTVLERSLNERMASERFDNWTLIQDNTSELHSTVGFEGELLFSLGRHFKVGLGTGLIYGELDNERTEITQGFMEFGEILTTFVYIHPVKVTAIPLTLSLYSQLDLSSRLQLYVKAGGGYLWAKYIDREGSLELPKEKYSYSNFQRTTSTGRIALGGLGFAFQIQSGLHLFLEGSYRHAKITGFTGENKKGVVGTLYSIEEYDSWLDFWQTKYRIFMEFPEGESIRSAKEAVVDFSGLALTTGLIIRF